MKRYLHVLFTVAALTLTGVVLAKPTTPAEVEPFLVEGRIQEGIDEFQQRDDSTAQYAVGVLKVLAAVEGLTQDLYRYGLRDNNPRLPFVRLPVPANDGPEQLTYVKWRQVLQDFVDDLDDAQQSLLAIQDEDVKLKLPVGLVRLDLNGDGVAEQDETFWRVFTAVAWRAAKLDEDQQRFEIGFDKADAHWMIGYTHLLQAMAEAWLAYDTEAFYNQTAPMFFAGAETPKVLLRSNLQRGFNPDSIADAIAAIHLMKFDVVEPERMKAALKHLQEMIAQSRQVWICIGKETDDDREWIPGPNQTSLTPLRVNQSIADGWQVFLDEADAVLAGEKLVPHWRVPAGQGININRVFNEPREFDLVMWVHGAAAVPYLEEGEVVSQETARTLNRIFQGRFVAFAIWFQ
ncbi:hypothetical protein NG895_28125 [Aeoliella sp. ICT_H6.2]|uniref:Uncharacterized protein n=1 Tax=Aeoliella straminimaris TaxID=2954799 RepID=A0A9X2FEZ4_9BACT|nr:hypothetical protein [Aeoliella straminimaris]MCO6047790.1 hypothetical protein [Aeoliella straminimaris]